MKTSSVCPVCQGKLSMWAGVRELMPNRMRCTHCKTQFRVQMPRPRLYYSACILIILSLALGIGATSHASSNLGLALGVGACVVFLILLEAVCGIVVLTYAKLIPEILDKSPTSETLRKLCKLKVSDVVLLLAPCVIVLIGLGILSNPLVDVQKDMTARSARGKISQHKWEKILERLDSGKAELNYDKATQDKIFNNLRTAKKQYALQLELNESIAGMLHSLLKLVALGVILQATAVICVAWRLKMRAVNSTLATQTSPSVEGCCKA